MKELKKYMLMLEISGLLEFIFPEVIILDVYLTNNNTKYFEPLIYINPFKSEFTIVFFIHYKPRISVAILDL